MKRIEEACERAQYALWNKFWDQEKAVFVNHYPVKEVESWIYWWHAHVLDTLLDGYARTKEKDYLERFKAEYEGVFRENGGTFLHNWYDDMEWMTLALIRAFDSTGEKRYMKEAVSIWNDTKTAWNNCCGGGMAWKKDQPDYKNTPANGPAAIIAFRLYRRLGRKEDLEWGEKILKWNLEHLMDPDTCFIWDGMNRLGDGAVDYDWKFTYCQGVIVGAAVEYAGITNHKEYLELAGKVARQAVTELADEDGIFPYEGPDDCGLFRGIFFRYVYELTQMSDEFEDLKEIIIKNARLIAEKGMNEDGLAGGNWRQTAEGTIDLAQHLSAVMTLEMAAKLSNR